MKRAMYSIWAREPRMKTADSSTMPLAMNIRWAGAGAETARVTKARTSPSQ